MASVGEGAVSEPSRGTSKKRSRIPVRVCQRRADVTSPICKIQRTLEAMNIDCGKGVSGASQVVVGQSNVPKTVAWWNAGATTISWASGLESSTPHTMFSTSTTCTPVSTPNFTPFQRPHNYKAAPTVPETPEWTPVGGGVVRRKATQHPLLTRQSHMNMVTPGFTPANGIAGLCYSKSEKPGKTSTPCWMMDTVVSTPSLSSSDLVLPTPPSSIKRPFPCPVPTQDSMEYIRVDSCTQKKLPRRRLPVVGEEPSAAPVAPVSILTHTTATHDQDLGVSTLDTSTHDCQTGLNKDKMLVCSVPIVETGPTDPHIPADSVVSNDCPCHHNNQILTYFQPKERLAEDQSLEKEHRESCPQHKGASSVFKDPENPLSVQHQVKSNTSKNEDGSYFCDAPDQSAQQKDKLQDSEDVPQNSSETCDTGQLNIKFQGSKYETRSLASVNHSLQGKEVAIKNADFVDNKHEDVSSAESESDSPPPVKVCRLSQSTDASSHTATDDKNCRSTVTDRSSHVPRKPPLARLRNSNTFNVLQNRSSESFSSDDDDVVVAPSPMDNVSDHCQGNVSYTSLKPLSDTTSPNLTTNSTDSALGLSMSSFHTNSHIEGAYGLPSFLGSDVIPEEENCIIEKTASDTVGPVSETEHENDAQHEQLLIDFKENMKLSGRRVHFKLSPWKHPAPPPSPSDTAAPCKSTKQVSPWKISKTSPRKSPRKYVHSPNKCSSPPKLQIFPGKLRGSPGKRRFSPSKVVTSTRRGGNSPKKLQHATEISKVRKSLLDDFGNTKTPVTIKRKLFSRDLPRRREAWSRPDVVPETEEINDSGLSLSLFVMNDHQPGSKVGWDYVDIIGELTRVCNVPMVVESILAYLDPADLSSVCCVSKEWNQACVNNRKAEQCRQTFLRQRKKLAPHVGKENLIKWCSRESGSLTETNVALATLQPQHVVMTPLQATPILSRHDQFAKLARLLPNGHSLTPCVRCRSPAHVFPKDHRATCQLDSCQFDYCLRCYCAFHGGAPCPTITPIATPPPKPGRKGRVSPVAGSRGSKRRLRRL